jgi:hypothetical protein
MKIYILLLSIIFSIFTYSNSFAQEKIIPDAPPLAQGEVDVGQAISPMKKNQIAPFTGVLLSPAAVAKILTELNSAAESTEIEVTKTKHEEVAKCDFRVNDAILPLKTDIKILNASNDEKKKRIVVLNETIKEQAKNQTNTPMWVALGVGTGFVVGALTTVLITYSVTQSSR